MARRSLRHSKPSARLQYAGDRQSDDQDDDDVPIAELTGKGSFAVKRSPRRTSRIDSKKPPSEALQRLTSLRKQRHDKVQADPGPSQNQGLSEGTNGDLTTEFDTQQPSTDQASDAEWQPGQMSDVSSVVDDEEEASEPELPAERPSAVKRRASKRLREASSPVEAARSPLDDASQAARRQRSRQAAQMPSSTQKTRRSKFVTGSARRSVSGSDGDDMEGFIASEDEEGSVRPTAKRHKPGKQRSARAKLDWTDSSSDEAQCKRLSQKKPERAKQGRAEDSTAQHVEQDGDVAGPSAVIDDEEEPQPARRHRQVSHIMGYEEEWEEAEGIGVAVHPQLPSEVHHNDGQRPQVEDVSDDEVHAVPVSGKRKRAVVLDDDDNDGPSTDEVTKRSVPPQPDTDEQKPSRQAPAAKVKSPAALLAEEGLDPIEETERSQPRRHSRGGSKVQGSIRERMQQNQQRLQEGGRRRPCSKAKHFVDAGIQHEWDGSKSRAPSGTDTDHSESEPNSPNSNADSGHSGHQGQDSEDGSDLAGFIVEDTAEAATHGPIASANANVDASAEAAHTLQQDQAAEAASMALRDAGFRSHQSDADCFANYVEYMVYDLVDNTFAVRVRQDRCLNQQYQGAIKKIEETLSERRDLCVVSSAWMKAFDDLLDNMDTYPGLSSDWAGTSRLDEAQDGVCQACQRGSTAGHAVKELTLKGRPYKRLWKYGFRRVSNAHVRRDLPYEDKTDEYGAPVWKEMRYSVGKYCCARLQLYHALMHYKHRLRGKLKKRIKKEHNITKLRREEGQDPWVQAAKSVLARTAVRESLFKHYTALVDLATNYNTHDRSGSWRKDQGYIGAEVDKLMYQLNSDSEGDEGSDIDPEADAEEEGSQSYEDQEDVGDGTAVTGEADAEADNEAEVRQGDNVDPSPSKRVTALGDQNASAAGTAAASYKQTTASHIGSAVQHTGDIESEGPEIVHNQDLSACKASVSGQMQDTQPDTLPYEPAEASLPSCTAEEASLPSSKSAEASLPSQTAGEQTLVYDTAPEGTPSATDRQTVPYDAVEGSQGPPGSSDMQLQLIDLTEVDAPQHHQQMPSKPALEQESLTAAQLPSEQSQADSTPRNALAPSKATASPARRSSLGNPMSPTTSSGRKHKQADIRGFLSPKSVCK